MFRHITICAVLAAFKEQVVEDACANDTLAGLCRRKRGAGAKWFTRPAPQQRGGCLAKALTARRIGG
jgi:hypothetical protein